MDSLKTMQSRDGWYDPRVLGVLGIESPSADGPAETGQIITVPLKELRPGLTLASPIFTRKGRMLVSAGTMVTATFLVRLNNYATTGGIREPIEVRLRTQQS
jgi:hypothetical protein